MLPSSFIVVLILALATTIQSVVGFGLALFAVPLLLMVGMKLLPAIFLVLTISFFSAGVGIGRLREEFELQRSIRASVYRAVGVIPGYFAAVSTAQSSPANIKAAMGFAIGLGVLAQSRKLLKRNKRREIAQQENREPSRKAAPWAFLSSGFLMGWLGMGGPPLVFWLLSGRETPKKTRSFLYGVYAFTIPLQLAIIAFNTPAILHQVTPLLLVSVPICLLISAVALQWGDKLDVDRLQWLSLALLTLLAAKAFLDWAQQVLV